MLPNDIFKRPGPHHAYEVDPARLAQLRAAADVFEQLGDAGSLAAVTGYTVEELHGYSLSEIYRCCLADEDFGLRDYGPMWNRMELQTEFGELLIPRRDARIDPVSHVWLEASPWLPQRVAPASEIYVDLELAEPPAAAWTALFQSMERSIYDHDLIQDDDESDEAFDARIAARMPELEREDRAMVERWRQDCRAELEMFRSKLRELGDRDALVCTWHDEQGWL
jgi:hypothetical protein